MPMALLGQPKYLQVGFFCFYFEIKEERDNIKQVTFETASGVLQWNYIGR
jgi:hypothetical protein